mmetsp:Transcript_54315/g.106285  ORF Transcript_54315/g.106285 Transcript_54315/m.106285 type:complete len:91 (+) Transcript_54315:484-756(+)
MDGKWSEEGYDHVGLGGEKLRGSELQHLRMPLGRKTGKEGERGTKSTGLGHMRGEAREWSLRIKASPTSFKSWAQESGAVKYTLLHSVRI